MYLFFVNDLSKLVHRQRCFFSFFFFFLAEKFAIKIQSVNSLVEKLLYWQYLALLYRIILTASVDILT